MRLLIVEDEPSAANTLARLLRADGYEVRVALDAASALSAAEAEPMDVVLLDIGLPGKDGYEVARQLREQGPEEGSGQKFRPVIIAITGHGADEERLRSYAVGMDLHLVKPVQPDELMRILERLQGVRK